MIKDGLLKDHELFVKISEALADKLRRANSTNPNAKYGIRYDQDVLNGGERGREYQFD